MQVFSSKHLKGLQHFMHFMKVIDFMFMEREKRRVLKFYVNKGKVLVFTCCTQVLISGGFSFKLRLSLPS